MVEPHLTIIGAAYPLPIGERVAHGIVTDGDGRLHPASFLVVREATRAEWVAHARQHSTYDAPVSPRSLFYAVLVD